MPTKLPMGGKIGVPVALGTNVGVGVRVRVTVGGMGVIVGTGVFVGEGVDVGGTGVTAGAHPVDKTVSTTNAKKTDCIDFFMFDLLLLWSCRTAPNGC